MAAVPPPTAQGMQLLVAALRPKPKRGRGGGPGRDGDDAKQKMVPCSVCDHGDEMMQMFGPKRCAACDASDGQEEPSLSQATRASESEMEDDLASESETEDEQVKTGEGKGKGSAPSTTPTLSATTPLNPPFSRSPSGSTSTPPCYRQIRQRSHSPSPAPSVPKRCIAPAPSRRLGCSKCRWSVKGCLQCWPLKHRAWKRRKLEKLKVEERELLD